METKRIGDDRRIPDALWERIEPLLPKYPALCSLRQVRLR
jgi:hypothetical protein